MKPLPPILHPPDGATPQDMIAAGVECITAQRRRKRLEWEHNKGWHRAFTEDCSLCERAVMAWLLANEPRPEIPRGFR